MSSKEQEYLKEEFIRARKNLYNSDRKSFGSRKNLAKWFVKKLEQQQFSCFYCGTSIFVIKELITAELLKTRSVRGGGKRGPVLEIDKEESYNDACVLSCYYCNNDKSYTTAREDYKNEFGRNRGIYFAKLYTKINEQEEKHSKTS